MFQIELFLLILLNSVITLELALTLFGSTRSFQKVLLVSLLTGGLDYLIMYIIVPTYNLSDGIQIIIGLILFPLYCRYILNTTFLGSVLVTLLSYILQVIAEFLIIILLIVFEGAQKVDIKAAVSIYGLTGLLILVIPIIYLKRKNIKLIKLSIEQNL